MSKNKINAAISVINEYTNILVPQANKLDKIMIAIMVLRHSPINEKDLATGFSMGRRQADYYANAMRFLGLIDSFEYINQVIICLTEKALAVFKKGDIKKALRDWIINNKLLEENKKRLDQEKREIDESREETSEGVKKVSTYKRRLQSYEAWKKWVNENI